MVETTNKGYVCQIIGPVLDIEFPSGNLPPIYSAIKVETEDGLGNVVEVQQLLGDNKVRAVSMRSTDGLKRGVTAVDLGCLLYTSPSPRDRQKSRMPSSA